MDTLNTIPSSLKYTAEYVSLVAYYDKSLRNPLATIEPIARRAFDIVGDLDILVQYRTGAPEVFTRRTKLGMPIIELDGGHCLWIGLSSAQPISPNMQLHHLWSLTYDVDGISYGTRQAPYLNITFGVSFLDDRQQAMLDNTIESILACCSQEKSLCYALIDVGTGHCATGYGRVYSSRVQGSIHFSRRVEQFLWAKAGLEQIQKARGVFWGNLLGQQMVEKLGGARDQIAGFVRSIGEYGEEVFNRDCAELTTSFPDGSVLLKLSTKLSSMFQPSGIGITPSMIERAGWLYQRLAAARLLLGM